MKSRLRRCLLPAFILILGCPAEARAHEGTAADPAAQSDSKHALAATTHAFDTGALNVYAKANTNPDYDLTVGNGRMGAMVWSNDGRTMQLSGADSFGQIAFSAGLVNPYINRIDVISLDHFGSALVYPIASEAHGNAPFQSFDGTPTRNNEHAAAELNGARVVTPWGNHELRIRCVSDNATINTVYAFGRTTKPLSSRTYTNIPGTANQSIQCLSGTSSNLGIPGSPPPDTAKHECEEATLVNGNTESDDAASNLAQVVNLRQRSSLPVANVVAGNTLDIRYCTKNEFGSYVGTNTTKTATVSIPAGATLKLQYDAGRFRREHQFHSGSPIGKVLFPEASTGGLSS
ncbi:hypothetical protein LZC95_13495 [Pendulispora brunnea]|uniref:Uncharacterized protein n=1 Tax=Pendulispora brunnea TaxID=2905690 RepID=A0ABZ2KGP3_9BACT